MCHAEHFSSSYHTRVTRPTWERLFGFCRSGINFCHFFDVQLVGSLGFGFAMAPIKMSSGHSAVLPVGPVLSSVCALLTSHPSPPPSSPSSLPLAVQHVQHARFLGISLAQALADTTNMAGPGGLGTGCLVSQAFMEAARALRLCFRLEAARASHAQAALTLVSVTAFANEASQRKEAVDANTAAIILDALAYLAHAAGAIGEQDRTAYAEALASLSATLLAAEAPHAVLDQHIDPIGGNASSQRRAFVLRLWSLVLTHETSRNVERASWLCRSLCSQEGGSVLGAALASLSSSVQAHSAILPDDANAAHGTFRAMAQALDVAHVNSSDDAGGKLLIAFFRRWLDMHFVPVPHAAATRPLVFVAHRESTRACVATLGSLLTCPAIPLHAKRSAVAEAFARIADVSPSAPEASELLGELAGALIVSVPTPLFSECLHQALGGVTPVAQASPMTYPLLLQRCSHVVNVACDLQGTPERKLPFARWYSSAASAL